ncbi:MAG: amino acid adenylation domain-containing protein, partial [Gordonia sp. (in: high G+C Gram-positive bacteria)]|nr:amino acid adenylation domain-containing protein [Gordonia sp. (in: high G+C Gram-positive bacteria)]
HRVRAVASAAGATEFMVLHAGLAALLSRLSAADDVVISTAVAGRGQEALERLVGMFVNTLALRAAVRPGMTFSELLAQIRDVDATAFANSDVPFESVVDAVDPVRSEAFAPLAQVSLEYTRAASTGAGDGVDTGTLRVAPYDQLDVPARLDLHFAVESTDAEWRLKVDYATDLFDADTVESFADSLVRLLDEFTAAPDTVRVGVADLVSPEQTAVLTAPATPAVEPRPLGELWDAHGADEPGDLIIGDRTMSRGEFDAATNRLARELLTRGLGPGDLVAILMRRSIHSVLAVVAVSKAGAAFVNIDPTQPVQRRDEILADSGAVFGLTVTGAQEELPDSVEWLTVDDTVTDHSADPIRRDELARPVHADDLAYLIYTSGSTGKPKAAALSHRGLANLVAGQRRFLHLGPATRMLHVASPTFDASIFELVALCTGSGIVISPADVYGGDDLSDVLAEGGVTHVVITPSMMDGLDPEKLPALSTLASVGEACPPDLRNRWVRAGRTFFNLYGPTESTIWGTGTEPSTVDGPIHIGGPLPGLGALVLGDGLRPVPVGVPGELYLTGDPLALGYLGRPDLSATRFVADLFGPDGTRMYRTGDRVVRTVSGDLEYLGRVDFQVKLRGQRIELGEIESVLSHAQGVRNVAIVVATAPSGGQGLVAYVAGDDLNRADLVEYAAQRLVAYMRPTVWMLVDEMPLTIAGKVDRRGLPSPEFGAADHVEPVGPAETAVAAVFAEILGTGQVSATESFFDAGGNSLSAMRVIARVSDALGVEVGVRDLFDAPTVRALVHRVAGRAPALPPVTRVEHRPDRIPLSFAQQRMWFINNFEPASATYNLPVLLRITGPLDADALRTALGDVVRRHEVLRTTFPTDEGVPYQQVAPADAVDDGLDWAHVDSESAVSSAATDGFDLAVDWPIRGRLLTVDASTHVFALVAHHIAADGESLQPLVGDIVTAYLARSAGREPEFAPLDVQFADFAIWQREVLGAPDDPTSIVGRQVGFWSDALAGMPDVLEIPTDRPRPQAASGRGGVADFEIPHEVGERIVAVASERGA